MKKIIAILIAAIFVLSACGGKTQTGGRNAEPAEQKVEKQAAENVTVYFADANAEGLVPQICEVPEKTPQEAVKALLKEPAAEGAVSVFGEGTELLGYELSGGEATVDLSPEFLQSVGDTLAIYSVVNTVTEFEEVNFVRITVNGEENAVLGNYILSESFTRNDSIILK